MNDLVRQNLLRRAQLRQESSELYDWLLHLLFERDPIGINYDQNTDEYEPEVGTILPRLGSCSNAEDVQRVIHEELCRWFDVPTAGAVERYESIAREVWERIRGTRFAGPAR